MTATTLLHLITGADAHSFDAGEGRGGLRRREAKRWPAIPRLDAARLFWLVLERGAVGVHYHGAADEGITVWELAEVNGRHLNLPVISKSGQKVAEHFGGMSLFVGMEATASSTLTRQQLDWYPTQPGLWPTWSRGIISRNRAEIDRLELLMAFGRCPPGG
jgi:hypothetical protein